MNFKKLIIKALVTFVEAAGAALLVADGLDRAALAGAFGSALSIVWNTVIYPQLQAYLTKQES